jgi:hypothetical protein
MKELSNEQVIMEFIKNLREEVKYIWELEPQRNYLPDHHLRMMYRELMRRELYIDFKQIYEIIYGLNLTEIRILVRLKYYPL